MTHNEALQFGGDRKHGVIPNEGFQTGTSRTSKAIINILDSAMSDPQRADIAHIRRRHWEADNILMPLRNKFENNPEFTLSTHFTYFDPEGNPIKLGENERTSANFIEDQIRNRNIVLEALRFEINTGFTARLPETPIRQLSRELYAISNYLDDDFKDDAPEFATSIIEEFGMGVFYTTCALANLQDNEVAELLQTINRKTRLANRVKDIIPRVGEITGKNESRFSNTYKAYALSLQTEGYEPESLTEEPRHKRQIDKALSLLCQKPEAGSMHSVPIDEETEALLGTQFSIFRHINIKLILPSEAEVILRQKGLSELAELQGKGVDIRRLAQTLGDGIVSMWAEELTPPNFNFVFFDKYTKLFERQEQGQGRKFTLKEKIEIARGIRI